MDDLIYDLIYCV